MLCCYNFIAYAQIKVVVLLMKYMMTQLYHPFFEGSAKDMGSVVSEIKKKPPRNTLLLKGCCKVEVSVGDLVCQETVTTLR